MMQCKCAVKDGHGVMQYHVSMAVLVLMSFLLLLLTFLNLLFGQSYLWKCSLDWWLVDLIVTLVGFTLIL